MVKHCLYFFLGTMLLSCGGKQDGETRENDLVGEQINIAPEDIHLIPQVKDLSFEVGDFTFGPNTIITFRDSSFLPEIEYLKACFDKSFSFSIPVKHISQLNTTQNLVWVKAGDPHDYRIWKSDEEDILFVSGGGRAEVFQAIQTLKQIIPFHIYTQQELGACTIPAFYLSDSPQYAWRGMLLDVCRHFFPKETVKKYIDLLAFYKFNVLHWHLTEDQAWRIQIDRYPKLTEVGAWRPDSEKQIMYGGFYTKEDIQEIVAYAQERHITIVPEIEMPGHSQAALAAYPHLACSEGPFEVATDWGVFKEIYCPTDSTFQFLENVLDEICELFPSPYIHIGGDEAPKVRWEESEYCQQLLKQENLKDFEELQAWFINRMAAYLKTKNKTVIGWDEIVNPHLNEDAIVQVWRDQKIGWTETQRGRKVIFSPTSHCYLDYGLDAIDVSKLYNFSLIPEDKTLYDGNLIMGGEVNMWTEHVPNDSVLDNRVFPRLLAASEVFWGTANNEDDFFDRLENHYPLLEKLGVKYGAAAIPFEFETEVQKTIDPSLRITLNRKEDIQAGFMEKEVWHVWEKDPVLSLGESQTFVVQAKKNGAFYGEPIVQTFAAHHGLDIHPNQLTYLEKGEPSIYYPGDILDGRKGSTDFRDGNWQAFSGNDMKAVIELDEPLKLTEVKMSFLQYTNAWIFFPKSCTVAISEDGVNYKKMAKAVFDEKKYKTRGQIIEDVSIKFPPKNVRYIKVEVDNLGKVPNWHEAAGEPTWIFIDEIELY